MISAHALLGFLQDYNYPLPKKENRDHKDTHQSNNYPYTQVLSHYEKKYRFITIKKQEKI